jgi:hypothetical protein
MFGRERKTNNSEMTKMHSTFNIQHSTFKTAICFWLLVFSSCLFVSCSKTNTQNSTSSTFIKVIATDSNFNAVNSFQMSDGSFIVFGADPQSVRGGLIVKLSSGGTILWEKRMPSSIAKLWKVISIQGGGFAATGFTSGTPDFNVNVCLFDNNGNLISSKSNSPGYYPYTNPLDMIQLNNGNYAFAGTLGNGSLDNHYVYLMITDEAFNVLYLNTYQLSKDIIYSVCMVESNDGTLNITGNYQNTTPSVPISFPFLLRANYKTEQKSFDTIANSLEAPDCVAANASNQVIIVSSSFTSSGSGVAVTDKYSSWDNTWGNIGIDIFDTGGYYNSHIAYSGYTNNCFINSITPTPDGGYILCGTDNMPTDTTSNTSTHIFAMKLNASLNEQWSNSYDTYYPSYGVNAGQTSDGGYLISGQHRSFNNHYDMVLIKTDANGDMN